MRREISLLLQPRWLLLCIVLLIFLIFAISGIKREEEKAEEVHEITHKVYLDVDIDEQRLGRIVIGLYGQVVPKTVGTEEAPSSPYSFDRVKEILSIDSSLRSCKVLLTHENLSEAGLRRGREMVSAEEALKFMEARAARKRKAALPAVAEVGPAESFVRAERTKKKKKKEGAAGPSARAEQAVRESLPLEGRAPEGVGAAAEVMGGRTVEVPRGGSVIRRPSLLTGFLDQLVLDEDLAHFQQLGPMEVAERAAHAAYEAMSSLSYLRSAVGYTEVGRVAAERLAAEAGERASEAESREAEAVQKAHKAVADCNAALARSAELEAELEAERARCRELLHLAQEAEKGERAILAELGKCRGRLEYFKDKSLSIEMYTLVKARAELMKEFQEGKSSSWKPEAELATWEKMKELYSGFDEEDEPELSAGEGPSKRPEEELPPLPRTEFDSDTESAAKGA